MYAPTDELARCYPRGQRVTLSAEGLYQLPHRRGTRRAFGTVVGYGRGRGPCIRVLVDGTKQPTAWLAKYWEPLAEGEEGEVQ